jgi:hypothetical protein
MVRRHARGESGLTLIEVMIAFVILLVGLLGMMKFQIMGITSTAAGRKHTVATELAQELMAGIELLPFGDPLLDPPLGTSGPTPPTPFGPLTAAGTVATGAHAWVDTSPIPGVRSASEAGEEYARRWTVWGYSPSSGALPAVKVVAVSVVYGEPLSGQPREVVLYTQLYESSAFISNVGANQ